MNERIDPQVQTMIDNMPEKTGKSLEEWYRILSDEKLEKHGEMMKLLKGDYGVSHGFANMIVLLYRQQAAGGPPPAEDLVSAQYAGDKSSLRPLYEAILAEVQSYGPDVEVAPKKSYVSLRRGKQFAIVQPTTRTRVDLGLNLKGLDATARLEGGNAFGGMCTHKVKLEGVEEIDAEVKGWLREAYEQA